MLKEVQSLPTKNGKKIKPFLKEILFTIPFLQLFSFILFCFILKTQVGAGVDVRPQASDLPTTSMFSVCILVECLCCRAKCMGVST